MHYIHRCKHCGKEYSWQASGEGCDNRLNNEDYCPDCMKAILEALDKIPVRYEKRFREIERPDDELIEKFRALIKKHNEEREAYEKEHGFNWPEARQFLYFPDWVKSAAKFSVEWVLYKVESPSDDPFDPDAKWYKQEEYDIIEKRVTDHRWLNSERDSYHKMMVGHFPKFNAEDIPERPMTQPSGKLWFYDILNLSK